MKKVNILIIILLFQFVYAQKVHYVHKVPNRAIVIFKKALLMRGSSDKVQKNRIRLFKKCLKIDPEFFEAMVNLSIVYLKLNKPKEALSYAGDAINLRPDSLKANLCYCESLEISGHYKKAFKALKIARTLFPSNIDLLECLVRVKYAMDQWDDVLNILSGNDQLREVKSMKEIYVFSLIKLKRWNDASAYLLNSSYKWEEKDPVFFYHTIYLIGKKSGRYHLAIQACLNALNSVIPLKDKKDFLLSLADLGLHLPIGEQLKKVFSMYKNEICKDTFLSLNWAQALAASDILDDAKYLLKKIVISKKPPILSFVLLSNIYLHERDLTRLDRICARGLKMFPHSAPLLYFKGLVLLEKKNYSEAMKYLKQSYFFKHSEVTLLSLQLAAIKENKPDSAIKVSKDFLKSQPKNEEIRYRLAQLECLAGKPDDAIADLEIVVKENPHKWLKVLNEQIKLIHSVFDCIRYKARFAKLLNIKYSKNKK